MSTRVRLRNGVVLFKRQYEVGRVYVSAYGRSVGKRYMFCQVTPKCYNFINLEKGVARFGKSLGAVTKGVKKPDPKKPFILVGEWTALMEVEEIPPNQKKEESVCPICHGLEITLKGELGPCECMRGDMQ